MQLIKNKIFYWVMLLKINNLKHKINFTTIVDWLKIKPIKNKIVKCYHNFTMKGNYIFQKKWIKF